MRSTIHGYRGPVGGTNATRARQRGAARGSVHLHRVPWEPPLRPTWLLSVLLVRASAFTAGQPGFHAAAPSGPFRATIPTNGLLHFCLDCSVHAPLDSIRQCMWGSGNNTALLSGLRLWPAAVVHSCPRRHDSTTGTLILHRLLIPDVTIHFMPATSTPNSRTTAKSTTSAALCTAPCLASASPRSQPSYPNCSPRFRAELSLKSTGQMLCTKCFSGL